MNSLYKIVSLALLNLSFIHCRSQDAALLEGIDKKLKANEWTVSQVLCTDSLMRLHSQKKFREVIRANAVAGKFCMTSNSEPGTKVTIKGSVTTRRGDPIADGLVYVYQTSAKGCYSDTGAHILINSGDMNHARLFAYFRTDKHGNFIYETIKPMGYPGSDLPAHIHIHIWDRNGKTLRAPGELLFDDDDRLTEERRKISLREGFLIVSNSGTVGAPVYEYKIIVDL